MRLPWKGVSKRSKPAQSTAWPNLVPVSTVEALGSRAAAPSANVFKGTVRALHVHPQRALRTVSHDNSDPIAVRGTIRE